MDDTTNSAQTVEDVALLAGLTAAVTEAGTVLLGRFSTEDRVDDLDTLLAAIGDNDAASVAVLRPALERLRPEARWDDDEEGRGSLGAGEWWVTDAAEGNVNHIHGRVDWGVTATLVRDDVPVVTAVFLPALGQTFTAVRGAGASLNGSPLAVSAKSDLAAALVGTGQAAPGEAADARRRMSASIDRMLGAALLVSATVPATLQLVQVAAGHTDAFWQYGQVRSGLVAGALLVQEAHGAVIDSTGAPWTLASDDFIATTLGLASGIAAVLR
ncbi:3'(2'),5'-bisphosphate nucleotidase CysQ [Curtobacterium sp. MCPF17_047]|uniref:inositol monophosphatase family protein n=1 Tax=unclassified Curtobacterium TaxID=257496 RepID=UPI000DA88997|nr:MULTISPECIES: inositol monophosphatase family protein [unclassified Curtobacterium]PZE60343.1 3'(2'),5'-bisphosphate nucleotidase CysQ [Curtobacterium sp. MCPF17_001]PZF67827.1 3'(2'),5'-bisphosphate nucleotidase CysQ [Curtobacterium sp. MCPF17_047]